MCLAHTSEEFVFHVCFDYCSFLSVAKALSAFGSCGMRLAAFSCCTLFFFFLAFLFAGSDHGVTEHWCVFCVLLAVEYRLCPTLCISLPFVNRFSCDCSVSGASCPFVARSPYITCTQPAFRFMWGLCLVPKITCSCCPLVLMDSVLSGRALHSPDPSWCSFTW